MKLKRTNELERREEEGRGGRGRGRGRGREEGRCVAKLDEREKASQGKLLLASQVLLLVNPFVLAATERIRCISSDERTRHSDRRSGQHDDEVGVGQTRLRSRQGQGREPGVAA
eukprot:765525-Hanusia_phi.AAC.8